MTKLKLGPIPDYNPVMLILELPAQLHRDLVVDGEILGREARHRAIEPVKLVVPMLERFIATDRGFAKARQSLSKADIANHEPGSTALGSRRTEATHPNDENIGLMVNGVNFVLITMTCI